jgi:hypothetical protein
MLPKWKIWMGMKIILNGEKSFDKVLLYSQLIDISFHVNMNECVPIIDTNRFLSYSVKLFSVNHSIMSWPESWIAYHFTSIPRQCIYTRCEITSISSFLSWGEKAHACTTLFHRTISVLDRKVTTTRLINYTIIQFNHLDNWLHWDHLKFGYAHL